MGSSGGHAQAISVSGGTVYAAGYYTDYTVNVPCYWEGTNKHDLPSSAESNGGYATSIAVAGGTVYAAGIDTSGADNKEVACSWVGSQRSELPGGNEVASKD